MSVVSAHVFVSTLSANTKARTTDIAQHWNNIVRTRVRALSVVKSYRKFLHAPSGSALQDLPPGSLGQGVAAPLVNQLCGHLVIISRAQHFDRTGLVSITCALCRAHPRR